MEVRNLSGKKLEAQITAALADLGFERQYLVEHRIESRVLLVETVYEGRGAAIVGNFHAEQNQEGPWAEYQVISPPEKVLRKIDGQLFFLNMLPSQVEQLDKTLKDFYGRI